MSRASRQTDSLTHTVRVGVAWSTLNNVVLRAGTFAVGIVLARLLTPEQFGVYAVALTVQAVLMTLADLGLSADLIRSREPSRRAATVGTLGLVSGTLLALTMAVSAHGVADLLGAPEAASVIMALSATLILAGAGVVPYAMLQRRFQQKALFAIATIDFVISTVVTIALVMSGWGVMALAVGRIAAQAVTLVLQFAFSRTRPRYSVERGVVVSVLAFGVPIALANMLSWALLNIDNVVIARMAGSVQLGFYVLAFNMSNWPMSAIGQVVRSIALPAFSRAAQPRNDPSLSRGIALTWVLALPAGYLLAVLARPAIELVYGRRWEPAVPVLAALGLFGALRVAFDLMVAYLLARGASRAVLWIQVLWFLTLVPAMILGTRMSGIVGGAWAHLAVAVVVALPAYVLAVRKAGADIVLLWAAAWPPLLAAVPSAAAGWFIAGVGSTPLISLLLGGLGAGAIYLLLLGRWLPRVIRASSRTVDLPATPSTSEPPEGRFAITEGG